MLSFAGGGRLALCFSLAGMMFLPTWVEFGKGEFLPHFPGNAVWEIALPTLLNHIAAALMFWAVLQISRAPARPLQWAALTVAPVIIVWGAMDAMFGVWIDWARAHPAIQAVLALMLGTTAWLAWRDPGRALRVESNVLRIALFPLALVLANAAAVAIRISPSQFDNRPNLAAKPGQEPVRRAVWVIFDELGASFVDNDPPSGVRMPEFERLKSRSVAATNAESPSANTITSVPALLAGRNIKEAHGEAPDDLVLTPAGGPPFRWSAGTNIFDETRRAGGGRTAAVGWYLPYSRALSRSLDESYWCGHSMPAGAYEAPGGRKMTTLMREIAEARLRSLAGFLHLPFVDMDAQLRRFRRDNFMYLRGHALRLAADPSVGLLFLHLPVPHVPGFLAGDGRAPSFFDNLRLADRTLGEIREAVRRAGLEDRTALLVSSDHPLRTRLWGFRSASRFTREEVRLFQTTHESRVPFLFSLPGQEKAWRHTLPMNTVESSRLILAWLDGRIRTPGEAAQWLVRGQLAGLRPD